MYKTEIFKEIKGYEGIYKVSDLGNVISLKNNIILKNNLNITKNGFKQIVVNLCKNNVCKSFTVKKLVFNTFVGFSKRVIKNINGDINDNRLTNLTDEECVKFKKSIKILDEKTSILYDSASLLAKELKTTSSVILYRIRNDEKYNRYKIQ